MVPIYRYYFFIFCLTKRNKSQGEKPYPFFLRSKSLRSSTRKICISLLFAKTNRTTTNVCVCLFNSIPLFLSKNQLTQQSNRFFKCLYKNIDFFKCIIKSKRCSNGSGYIIKLANRLCTVMSRTDSHTIFV